MAERPPSLPADDAHPKLSKDDYEDRLRPAQYRMRTVALAGHTQGHRGIVVVEGGDTAGKGGAIRRLIAELDPRFFHVWPIGPPTPAERGQHYLQRFWARLPPAGQIAIFDRSWYGRVLVERVDGLTPADRWRAAYDEINAFEQALIDDGIRIAKFYFHVTRDEQQARLVERVRDRFKWWKISEADIRAHLAYDAYREAATEMLERTSTAAAPWHVIAADDKRHSRLVLLDTVAEAFARGVDTDPTPLTADLHRLARDVLGVDGEDDH
ncbi:MAG: polyphosphate kinase [Alphaproteobacteria bacterium]|nr:polyphosphate kinase [Alphaproteobacteria bacterium]MCB9928435.1 polyphosphate kinase [Alphaproteobacteria bacterium]